jgi:hypothetical protein
MSQTHLANFIISLASTRANGLILYALGVCAVYLAY